MGTQIMTPEEKIAALVEQIKTEFPNGCRGIDCDKCILRLATARSTENAVCELLNVRRIDTFLQMPPS